MGAVAALVVLLAVGPVAEAQVGPDGAAGPPLTGSWTGTATPTDAPLPPLRDLITFAGDGTVLEAHRPYVDLPGIGPALVTPGHGSWKQSGPRQYGVVVDTIYEGASDNPTAAGEVVALEQISFRLTVSTDGRSLTGDLVDHLERPDGTPVFDGAGTFDAVRIQVGPRQP
jgi:hypothetical protein